MVSRNNKHNKMMYYFLFPKIVLLFHQGFYSFNSVFMELINDFTIKWKYLSLFRFRKYLNKIYDETYREIEKSKFYKILEKEREDQLLNLRLQKMSGRLK